MVKDNAALPNVFKFYHEIYPHIVYTASKSNQAEAYSVSLKGNFVFKYLAEEVSQNVSDGVWVVVKEPAVNNLQEAIQKYVQATGGEVTIGKERQAVFFPIYEDDITVSNEDDLIAVMEAFMVLQRVADGK